MIALNKGDDSVFFYDLGIYKNIYIYKFYTN
jgi:hypothetical protein